MTKQNLCDDEHEARCDLIDVMGMLEVAITHGRLTDDERAAYGQSLVSLRAKYPQQKAPRASELKGECICPTCGLRHGSSNFYGGF